MLVSGGVCACFSRAGCADVLLPFCVLSVASQGDIELLTPSKPATFFNLYTDLIFDLYDTATRSDSGLVVAEAIHFQGRIFKMEYPLRNEAILHLDSINGCGKITVLWMDNNPLTYQRPTFDITSNATCISTRSDSAGEHGVKTKCVGV